MGAIHDGRERSRKSGAETSVSEKEEGKAKGAPLNEIGMGKNENK